MRKFLPILLAAAVYLAPLYPVYAQTSLAPSDESTSVPFTTIGTASTSARLPGAVRDKLASRAAELQAKLAKFKDKIKAKRVESINNNLNNVNTRRTRAMTQNLERMSQILVKLKARLADAQTAGKDVTELNTIISGIEARWSEADAAVKTQAEKDYSITVNTEATVKEDATAAKEALRADLKALHTQVVDVRQSLANAIQSALNSVGGNNAAQ